jgi:hydroxyacylglutathione hydrolase
MNYSAARDKGDLQLRRGINPNQHNKRKTMSEIIEIGPVTYIQGENKGRYPFCNSIYIEQAGIIIDPASNRKILEGLKSKIRTVWLSHWHEDHIMHLDLFENCSLQMHELDEPPLADMDTFVHWNGINAKDEPEIVKRWKKLLVEQFNYKNRKADNYLRDGDIIRLEDLTIEIIHVPGHSPGNLALYFQEPQILFMGDYDLTPFGPWYGDRFSDIDQTIKSINRLREFPAKTFLTGHEHSFMDTDPGEAWDRYLKVIERRENKLLEFLKEPRTLAEIGKAWIVYGKPREPIAEFEHIEQMSMKKHADRLIRKGLVRLKKDHYMRA